MNIKEFKAGDIITRNVGVQYDGSGLVDGSYLGDRLKLRGHDIESKIIFLENLNPPFSGDIIDLSYGRDKWDEGWCFYPETLWQKVKNKLSK